MWAAQWYSKNRLDGEIKHLINDKTCTPVLFRHKKDCSEYIKQHYGYIARRKDLRAEPHGWRMPKPVRVRIEVI